MTGNLSNITLSNTSTKIVQAQQELNDYQTPVEMASQIRHTQTGRIGMFAALTMLVLYIYITYNYRDDEKLQVLSFITFSVVEIFILSLFRFQII